MFPNSGGPGTFHLNIVPMTRCCAAKGFGPTPFQAASRMGTAGLVSKFQSGEKCFWTFWGAIDGALPLHIQCKDFSLVDFAEH